MRSSEAVSESASHHARHPAALVALLAGCLARPEGLQYPPAQDPLRAALEPVRRAAVERDVAALVGVRHAAVRPQGLEDAERYLRSEYERAGFSVRLQPVSYARRSANNVLAERVGADPSRVVLATAHYDTVALSPGADDNASGVAVTLAIARAASRVRTSATVRLVNFAFEEDGLRGSAAYVDSLGEGELRALLGVYNFDMVGYTRSEAGSQRYPEELRFALGSGERQPRDRGDFVGVVGLGAEGELLEVLRAARAYEPALRVEWLQLPSFVRPWAGDLDRGDHASFWDARVPAVMIGDTGDFRNPHYHRASDALATLDLAFLARVARWASAAVLLHAGLAP